VIYFHYIEIENFLSVAYARIHFQDGLYAVTGENRDRGGSNGAGKSTPWEALKWVLSDTTFRDPEKKDDIIRRGAQWVRVSLEFRRGPDVILVSRFRHHPKDRTGVRVLINGEVPTEERHSHPAGLIAELLGMGPAAFVATTFFGYRIPSFLSLRDADRKQLLLRAAGSAFDVASRRVAEHARTVRQRIHSLQSDLVLLSEEERPIDPGPDPGLEAPPDPLRQMLVQAEQRQTYLAREVQLMQERLRLLAAEQDRQLEELTPLLSGQPCPLCGSHSPADPLLLQTHLEKLTQTQSRYESTSANLPRLQQEWAESKTEVELLRPPFEEANQLYQRSVERRQRWSDDMRRYQQSTVRRDLDQIRRRLERSQELIKDLEDVGDTYSASGYPAWEVARLLPELNEELTWVLRELSDIEVEIVLDAKGTLQVKVPDTQLGLLSGGEGQIVDFAVNMAGALVARRRYEPTNIFVIDEGAWAVDGQGVERLVQFLTELLQRVPSIYVISHRQDMLSLPRRLVAIKEGGKTTYGEA
jgi:DNA repair exonuclease SbcCD ATPase subunit